MTIEAIKAKALSLVEAGETKAAERVQAANDEASQRLAELKDAKADPDQIKSAEAEVAEFTADKQPQHIKTFALPDQTDLLEAVTTLHADMQDLAHPNAAMHLDQGIRLAANRDAPRLRNWIDTYPIKLGA